MIAPVAVEGNKLKAVYSCTAPNRGFHQCSSKRLFYCPFMSAVPHTIASIYMDGVGENIGQRYTPLITLADCVRGTA